MQRVGVTCGEKEERAVDNGQNEIEQRDREKNLKERKRFCSLKTQQKLTSYSQVCITLWIKSGLDHE